MNQPRSVTTLCPFAAVCALALGLLACGPTDPRDAPGCKIGSRRCDADWVQLCVPDPRIRVNNWVNALDCTELDEDVCAEQSMTGNAWADCVPTEKSAVR